MFAFVSVGTELEVGSSSNHFFCKGCILFKDGLSFLRRQSRGVLFWSFTLEMTSRLLFCTKMLISSTPRKLHARCKGLFPLSSSCINISFSLSLSNNFTSSIGGLLRANICKALNPCSESFSMTRFFPAIPIKTSTISIVPSPIQSRCKGLYPSPFFEKIIFSPPICAKKLRTFAGVVEDEHIKCNTFSPFSFNFVTNSLPPRETICFTTPRFVPWVHEMIKGFISSGQLKINSLPPSLIKVLIASKCWLKQANCR
mmetsp:Transcript_2334/g.3313  ORF Transcript_2334/g.3313 Transcript_2334/m.3313 type:complete len:256 (+) Transcript_2334:1807-2574(+)